MNLDHCVDKTCILGVTIYTCLVNTDIKVHGNRKLCVGRKYIVFTRDNCLLLYIHIEVNFMTNDLCNMGTLWLMTDNNDTIRGHIGTFFYDNVRLGQARRQTNFYVYLTETNEPDCVRNIILFLRDRKLL